VSWHTHLDVVCEKVGSPESLLHHTQNPGECATTHSLLYNRDSYIGIEACGVLVKPGVTKNNIEFF